MEGKKEGEETEVGIEAITGGTVITRDGAGEEIVFLQFGVRVSNRQRTY